jgi:D-alanyl-D-alanine carboxypeptidase (penicillin-binding protein 5/6)
MKRTKFLIVFFTLFIVIKITSGFNYSVYANELNFKNIPMTNTFASSEITMEINTNRVLFSDNAQLKRPMASTTKIMTAITVIENIADLNETVEIKSSYTGIEGSSIYLQAGEKLTIKELLYGLMLQSGNDCAVALACHTSGSIDKFAELMNTFAKSLGATNTNFTNPHGLHNDNHYTTAYDLAKISCYAMKNVIFKEIVSTKSIKISSPYSNYRLLLNKNKMLKEYDGATGIKTGFTKKAGRCLVSSANKNGMEVVCVVLGCSPMFERSKNLLDKSYNEYEYTEIFNADLFNEKVKIIGTDIYCQLKTNKSFYYPIKKNEINDIKINIVFPKEITPPFEKEDIVGKIEIFYENQLLFSENIYTIIGVQSKDYNYIINDIIASWRIF